MIWLLGRPLFFHFAPLAVAIVVALGLTPLWNDGTLNDFEDFKDASSDEIVEALMWASMLVAVTYGVGALGGSVMGRAAQAVARLRRPPP